jgi:hypothetical protein
MGGCRERSPALDALSPDMHEVGDIGSTPLARGAGAASSMASLSESEARYRSALKAGRMGSWETDFINRTRTWSEEGMALFGLSLPGGRGQVGGSDDEYERALHPAIGTWRIVTGRRHRMAGPDISGRSADRCGRCEPPSGACLQSRLVHLHVLPDSVGRVTDRVDCLAQLRLCAAERLAPITHLVLFGQGDKFAIETGLFRVVSHGIPQVC